MFILLKIAAILAFIILPLIPRKKKITKQETHEASDFMVDEDGDISNKNDNPRQRARN